jgi:hypothetical protein
MLTSAVSNVASISPTLQALPSFPRKRESTAAALRAFNHSCSRKITFAVRDEMLPMVGEIVLIDVVVSVDGEVTLSADQR